MSAEACALALCNHHVDVQKKKGDKRAWFDWLGGGRIFMRLAYRLTRPELYVRGPERCRDAVIQIDSSGICDVRDQCRA